MMRTALIFLACLLVMSACRHDPCSDKETFLESFSDFVEEASEDSDDLSESDWKRMDEQFDRFIDVCYEDHRDDLSPNEKKRFWKQAMTYYYTRHGRDLIRELLDESNELAETLREGLSETWDSKEIRDLIREVSRDEVKGALRELVDGVESIGDAIREWLDEDDE